MSCLKIIRCALLSCVFWYPFVAIGLRVESRGSPNYITGYSAVVDDLAKYSSKFARAAPPQNCNEKHPDDIYRPIKEVLKEHPGMDGNCWFHFYADYLGNPENYTSMFIDQVKYYGKDASTGPLKTLHLPNGEELTLHDDDTHWGIYAYDDAMCHQMGWLKGQRLDKHLHKLHNEEEWLKVAEDECQHMLDLVNESDMWMFDENSKYMTIGYMQDDNWRIMDGSNCLFEPLGAPCKKKWSSGQVQKATVLDWVLHLYPKCLLGGERNTGAAGQIAWCAARGCVDEKNKVIKHGTECWPDGINF